MGSIALHGVTQRFENGQEALRDVSLTFEEGSMTFLTGHSGAGKSTFLKLLLRLQVPTQGQIVVNGVNICQLPRNRVPRYRQHLGAVFQDHHLLADRTVIENVAVPLLVTSMRKRDIATRARAALSMVGLLAMERLYPSHLSAGEQQRVGIARAVVNRPNLILADEPTGNLDPGLSRDVMGLFVNFRRIGATVIVASHDHELIESMGVRVIELDQGRVVRDEAPAA
ncbi:MAG: ATP-binding cassette domain-containing protein [Gammaproteobacteria bacterium]|nr:ATP-binding cassette domain-containing protein [Gammaproteobacteria bacterium]